MRVRISAMDTLFFRDGRPFAMGDDSWARGVFPPLPPTIYGALRSAYIAHNGGLDSFLAEEMKEDIGTVESPGRFKVRWACILKGADLLCPAPLDMCLDKTWQEHGGERYRIYVSRLSAEPAKSCVSDAPFGYSFLPPASIRAKGAEGFFVSVDSIRDYLLGRLESADAHPLEGMITPEPKTGIRRDVISRTAASGHLYQVSMVRPAVYSDAGGETNFDLVAGCDGLDAFPEEFLIRLGGESKAAAVTVIRDSSSLLSEEDRAHIKDSIGKTGMFRVYLMTPAVFNRGWLPGSPEQSEDWSIAIKLGPLRLRLMAAALGSFITTGGWDIQRNMPKVMMRAVPAGSVYAFKIDDGDADTVIEVFMEKNLSEDRPEEGLGFCLLGVA